MTATSDTKTSREEQLREKRARYGALVLAEEAYLLAAGWTKTGPDEFTSPDGSRTEIRGGHAVNIQKQEDRWELFGALSSSRSRNVLSPASSSSASAPSDE